MDAQSTPHTVPSSHNTRPERKTHEEERKKKACVQIDAREEQRAGGSFLRACMHACCPCHDPPVVYPPTPEQARTRDPLLCMCVQEPTCVGGVGLNCYTATLAHGIFFFLFIFPRGFAVRSLFGFLVFFWWLVGIFEMPTGSHRFQTELAPTCEAAAAGRARKHGVVDPSCVTVSTFTASRGSSQPSLCFEKKDKNGD